jgi:hypothetical protein
MLASQPVTLVTSVCTTVSSHGSSRSSLQPAMAKRRADDACLSARGSSQQKARWARSATGQREAQPETTSKLASFLVEKWGWGLISAPFMQQIAELAVEGGAKHQGLILLSNLGAFGKYPGKCHGDLLCKLPPVSMDHAFTNFPI